MGGQRCCALVHGLQLPCPSPACSTLRSTTLSLACQAPTLSRSPCLPGRRGGPVTPLLPVAPGGPSALAPQPRDWDVLLTAETHNFPCAVAPYPGGWAGGRAVAVAAASHVC